MRGPRERVLSCSARRRIPEVHLLRHNDCRPPPRKGGASMPLRVETLEGYTVVKVSPRDVEEANIQALGEGLARLVDGLARPMLRLDLAEVRYLTSTALGKFITLHKRVAAAKGRLVLDNLADNV